MRKYIKIILILQNLLFLSYSWVEVKAQEEIEKAISYEDYVEGFIDTDETYLASLEEWQNVIEQWLEDPICINNEEADWLVEYKIISLYQLNKLKEYRLIYSELLSVYELANIDGWDFQTIKKVTPLITVKMPANSRLVKKFNAKSIKQVLILKFAMNSEQENGYKETRERDSTDTETYYKGPPARVSFRYDLEYRNKVVIGLRMEKDPGEPFFFKQNIKNLSISIPDLLAGYLLLKQTGPFKAIIVGNYHVSFGYGLNISGGFAGIEGRNGMAGIATRISPHSSVSESGYFRGAAIHSELKRISVSCFGSSRDLDGTSVNYDTVTGKVVSFSSVDKSGLHRSGSEIEGRKNIRETVAGGFIVYGNNWLKAGMIAIYNRFDAKIAEGASPYQKFNLQGNDNLIAGIAATTWLPKFQVITEVSVSKNKSLAFLGGIQLTPVPGIQSSFSFRKFGVEYQNWIGAGFTSAGNNSAETGFQFKLRIELPKKYLLELMLDESQNQWISYDLASPSREREIKMMADKSWSKIGSITLTFRYLNSYIKDEKVSEWLCHPIEANNLKFRIEGRIEAAKGIRLKSRIECNYAEGFLPGWLIFQDIEFDELRIISKIWLRCCFFDTKDFESRIYSYENDVLYDFSSFMHYGKGLRGIIMFRHSPAKWIDIWLRLSSVYYTNKFIGTGWDATNNNRQNEAEIQVRISWPAQ